MDVKTPPQKVALTNSDDVPTVIVNEDQLQTPILDYSKLKPISNLGKRNLKEEFENASNEDARSKKVGLALEEIQNRLKRQYEEDLKKDDEYNNRVDETAKMTFKLPAKRQKTGGRKSSKRNKKHRKKTSKKRRSRK